MCYRRWSGGDWRIGRVEKGDEARGMRQSAWLKRLVRHATRMETAQSSNLIRACICDKTRQTRGHEVDQIPARCREMPGSQT